MTTIQVNQRGTLTLPKQIRKKLGLEKGGSLMALTTDDGVVLKPAVVFPIEMYSDDRIKEFDAEEAALRAHMKKKGAR